MSDRTDRALLPTPITRDDAGPAGVDDPRVARALEEYLAAVEAGRPPDRAEFLARHAAIARPLAGCLAGLALMAPVHRPRRSPPDGAAGEPSRTEKVRVFRF